MTKRFHIINGAENLVKYGIYCKPVLVDEETGKQYVLALDLMDILNELYEENKKLKKETQQLRKALWEAEESYIYETNDNSIDIEKDMEYLKKEFEGGYWND